MPDLDTLPIPDWGLSCPNCKTPLAGMQSHRCARCGEVLPMVTLIATARPIPPIGLTCPACGYLLTGLMRNRCPECGRLFYVRDLIEESVSTRLQLGYGADPPDHHMPKREPQLTGRERPFPDLGLRCRDCEQTLAGMTGETCPSCGAIVDVFAIPHGGEWVDINPFLSPRVAPLARRTLYAAQIPYTLDEAASSSSSSANFFYDLTALARPVVARLLVPRLFFLDALLALRAVAPETDRAIPEWTCPKCGEVVPAGFEICWNCQADYPSG